jgi:hypothetical protein
MSKPTDIPSEAEFGQFISKTVPDFYANAVEAHAVFGGTANGRSWKQIGDDGIKNQVLKANGRPIPTPS